MPEHLQEDDDFPKTPPTQPATPAIWFARQKIKNEVALWT